MRARGAVITAVAHVLMAVSLRELCSRDTRSNSLPGLLAVLYCPEVVLGAGGLVLGAGGLVLGRLGSFAVLRKTCIPTTKQLDVL